MNESVIWLWCGENVNGHDLNNWRMLRKLLEINKQHGNYIIEFASRTELQQFEAKLQAKGWQVDDEASENTPHVTCWKRSLAFRD